MVTGINESKTLTKYISCECKCKFGGRKYNSNQWWNNDKCRCECKKHYICEKDHIWNPATCSYENGKYLASIIDNTQVYNLISTNYKLLLRDATILSKTAPRNGSKKEKRSYGKVRNNKTMLKIL